MPEEWFKMVKEEEDEDDVLYSCQMIIVDLQEHSVQITQDNLTSSHMIDSTYRQIECQARVAVEVRGLDWRN